MSQALQEGTVFANRYRVLQCIAQGGMGAVYEVIHLETERRRALKVMHAHTLQSDDLRERFKREARVAAHVESEFIVDVFDAGVDEATRMPFLVMELLRGEELGKRLKRLGRLPAGEVVAYLHQTALALDKTHKASIIHRDLKPENLFLTDREDGPPRVKVLDFGIAKIIAEGVTNGGATQSIGTPLYMSPEQFNPTAKLSGASDIYSLGMVAYALLVGAPYWAEEGRGGNIFAIAVVAIQGPKEAASVRAARKGVTLPAAFDAWFARITAVDPVQRFAPATAAVRELALALGVPLASGGPALSTSGVSFEAPATPAVAPIMGPPNLPSTFAVKPLSPASVQAAVVPSGIPPAAPLATAVVFASSAPHTPGTILFGPPSTQVLVPSAGPEATGTTSSVTGIVPPAEEKRNLAPFAGLAVGITILAAALGAFFALRTTSNQPHAATEANDQATPSSTTTTSEPSAPSTADLAKPTGSVGDPPSPTPSSSAPQGAPARRQPAGDTPLLTPAIRSKAVVAPATSASAPSKGKYTRD